MSDAETVLAALTDGAVSWDEARGPAHKFVGRHTDGVDALTRYLTGELFAVLARAAHLEGRAGPAMIAAWIASGTEDCAGPLRAGAEEGSGDRAAYAAGKFVYRHPRLSDVLLCARYVLFRAEQQELGQEPLSSTAFES